MDDPLDGYDLGPIFEDSNSRTRSGNTANVADGQDDGGILGLDNIDFSVLGRANQGGNNGETVNNDNSPQDDDAMADILGVDSEITTRVQKRRAKLDAERLLSSAGLPALKNEYAKRIRLKGKGHELRDLDRVLDQYQLWAHSLFPKATFQDFITMIRKRSSEFNVRLWRGNCMLEEQTARQTAQASNTAEVNGETAEGTTEGTEPSDIRAPEEQRSGTDIPGGPGFIPDLSEDRLEVPVQEDSLFVDDDDDDIYADVPAVSSSRPSTRGVVADDDDENSGDEADDREADKERENETGNEPPSDKKKETDREHSGEKDTEKDTTTSSDKENDKDTEPNHKSSMVQDEDDLEARLIREAEELGF